MKAIVEKVRYDTDTADLLGVYGHVRIYRGLNGHWFREEHDKIRPIKDWEIELYLESIGAYDLLEEYCGDNVVDA